MMQLARAGIFPQFEITIRGKTTWVCAQAAARAIEATSDESILGTHAKDADTPEGTPTDQLRTMTKDERDEIIRLVEVSAAE